jgi:2-keto-3-deoxy-L-rhamnonate aldolase RhmA
MRLTSFLVQTFFMRKSKILSKLRKGEVARIACLYYPVTMFAQHAANAGYDGIWLDSEHNMWDPREIERMLTLHHLADIDCIVRTQFRESATGYQMLERGATGLMFPLINTGEEARDIAGRTKFPPLGQRGLDAAGLDNRFYLDSPSEYVKDANEETITVIQIETQEAVENVEEIAAAPGVDVLFIGWGDLALRLGCEINFKEPKMADAQKKVAQAAQKNGINWGRPTGTPEDMTAMIEAGGRFIAMGSDFGAIFQSLPKWAEVFDEVTGAKPA